MALSGPQRNGFTLLEVLVALVILAAVLYAASGGLRSAVRQQDALERRVLAHWVAADTASELSLAVPAEPGQAFTPPPSREVQMGGRDFALHFALMEEQLPEADVPAENSESLRRLVIEVSAVDRPSEVLSVQEIPVP